MADNEDGNACLGCGCIVLISVGIGLAIWGFPGCGSSSPPTTSMVVPSPTAGSPTRSEAVLGWKQKVKDWRAKQLNHQHVMSKLEKDKEDVLRRLDREGVSSPADLKDKPRARRYAEELREVVAQITLIQKKYEEREDAIDQMEGAIRRYDRMMLVKEVGVTEQELADISRTIHALDAKLVSINDDKTGIKDLQVDEILEKEMKNRKH